MKRKLLSFIVCGVLVISNLPYAINAKAEGAPLIISSNKTDRLSGGSRYETSAAISKKGWSQGTDYAIIVSGKNFPDALCAGPLAKKLDAPIILTNGVELENSTKQELERLKPKHLVIIGGSGAVSENVKEKLTQITSDVKRIYGSDRYETSLAVAKELGEIKNVVIASGEGYADALAIAPIAAQKSMPILLSSKTEINESIKKYVETSKLENTYIIGGMGVIDKSVEAKLKNTTRIAGVDRFETNLKVVQAFASEINFNNIFIALGDGPNGDEFADALSGAALAAKTSSVIFLVNKTMSSEAVKYIQSKTNSNSVITSLGGEAVVPSEITEKILNKQIIEEKEKGNTNNGNDNTNNNGQVTSVIRLDDGSTNLKITLENGKVIFNMPTLGCDIAVSVTDSKNNINYINVISAVSDSYKFGTVLSSGAYEISINAKGKILTQKFNVN